MAKAINWPVEFRDLVLAEDTEALHSAVRLGDLYYVNRYWVPEEVVDIRVNHRKIRKAVVVGELKCCALAELGEDDFARLKPPLRSVSALIAYLAKTYPDAGPVLPESLVTLVHYRNLALVPEEIEAADDPHM